MKLRLVSNDEERQGTMSMKKGERISVTHKDVEMDILGEIRLMPEVRVEYVKEANGKVSRTMSFEEYARLSDEIHRQLRARRKVYSELD